MVGRRACSHSGCSSSAGGMAPIAASTDISRSLSGAFVSASGAGRWAGVGADSECRRRVLSTRDQLTRHTEGHERPHAMSVEDRPPVDDRGQLAGELVDKGGELGVAGLGGPALPGPAAGPDTREVPAAARAIGRTPMPRHRRGENRQARGARPATGYRPAHGSRHGRPQRRDAAQAQERLKQARAHTFYPSHIHHRQREPMPASPAGGAVTRGRRRTRLPWRAACGVRSPPHRRYHLVVAARDVVDGNRQCAERVGVERELRHGLRQLGPAQPGEVSEHTLRNQRDTLGPGRRAEKKPSIGAPTVAIPWIRGSTAAQRSARCPPKLMPRT